MRNEILAHAREKAGLTQMELAKKARISLNSYQRYETGVREPTVSVAQRIAEALDSDPWNLFSTT